MCELSAADGFVELHENLGDMIKYVANEPSVGLYYIQLHAQNAIPNVVRLKNSVSEKSQELSLHTEDLEDSISATRSMKQCGLPIIDEMISDIKTSLTLMSTKKPVRGVIHPRSSSYQTTAPRLDPLASVTWARSTVIDGEGENYFSSMLKSAKEKAGNIKWPPLDPRLLVSGINDESPEEGDELPLSSPVLGETVNDREDVGNPQAELSDLEYDEFKADREAKLEEWLKGNHENMSL